MSAEKEYEEPPGPDDPPDKEIFDEVVADICGYGAFERSLSEAAKRFDPEDLACARDGADHLRALLALLKKDDPAANLKQREREMLYQAQALATHGTDGLFACFSALQSPVAMGDALDALAALVEAAFYMGRCSTAAQQTAVQEQSAKRPRGEIEQLKCKRALRELYEADPRAQGLHRETIRQKVMAKASVPISLSTLDRAIRCVWPDKT